MRRLGRLIVRLFALVGFLFIASIAVLAWLALQYDPRKPDPLPDRVMLTIDLNAGLREGDDPHPIRAIAGSERGYPLHTVLEALRHAEADPRVVGVTATLDAATLGPAQIQELREAIELVRLSGKSTLLYTSSMDGAGATFRYYLAAAFQEIWMQPSGELGIIGLSVESPFLADALRRIGVETRFAAREEYKSVMESLTRTGFSAPAREDLSALVNGLHGQMVADIARNRNLDAARVTSLIDRAPLFAEEALDAGLIDRLAYRDALKEHIRRDGAEPVDLMDYLKRLGPELPEAHPIALIHAAGTIHDRAGDDGFGEPRTVTPRAMERAFESALEDDAVRAVVLRVNSPGGTYIAADAVRHTVAMAARSDKPVIVSIGDVGASGGYFIALPAHSILAQPASVTGSIGVVSGKFLLRGLWDELDVRWDGVEAGARAGMWSPNRDFTLAEWRRFNASLDRIYQDFTGHVAQARGLDGPALDRAARGRVFLGKAAMDVGLVDAIGGLDAALTTARRAAGIPDDEEVRLVPYPPPRHWIEELVRLLDGDLPPFLHSAPPPGLVRVLEAAAPILHRLDGVDEDLRMPPLEIR